MAYVADAAALGGTPGQEGTKGKAGPSPRIARSIMWKKFEAMAEGAQIATDQLWG